MLGDSVVHLFYLFKPELFFLLLFDEWLGLDSDMAMQLDAKFVWQVGQVELKVSLAVMDSMARVNYHLHDLRLLDRGKFHDPLLNKL